MSMHHITSASRKEQRAFDTPDVDPTSR